MNNTSDLAQSGGEIHQFSDAYLSIDFAFVSADRISNYSTIVQKPKSVQSLNCENRVKRRRIIVEEDEEEERGVCSEGKNHLPTCFVLDGEINKWRRDQLKMLNL